MHQQIENDLEKRSSALPAIKIHSAPLQQLNEAARRRTFELSDVDWSLDLDPSRSWIPESIVSVSYLPSYRLLPGEVKLRYNQLYALSVCEQFVWFEQYLVSKILIATLAKRELANDLRLCLENFVIEETKHSEMFKRILLKGDRDFYSSGQYQFFALHPLQNVFFEAVTRWPDLFLNWIWMAIYFEERTLHISQVYRRAQDSSHPPIDPLFSRVHALHMVDEARHLQIDQYLLKEFFDPEKSWKKKLAAELTYRVVSAYRSPRRVARRILERLAKEFPSERGLLASLNQEIPLLAQSPEFSATLFGQDAIGRTRELLRTYPEMKKAYQVITR